MHSCVITYVSNRIIYIKAQLLTTAVDREANPLQKPLQPNIFVHTSLVCYTHINFACTPGTPILLISSVNTPGSDSTVHHDELLIQFPVDDDVQSRFAY